MDFNKRKHLFLVVLVLAVMFTIKPLANGLAKLKQERVQMIEEVENLKKELSECRVEIEKTKEEKENYISSSKKTQDSYLEILNDHKIYKDEYLKIEVECKNEEEKYNEEVSNIEDVVKELYVNSKQLKVERVKDEKNIFTIFNDFVYVDNIIEKMQNDVDSAKIEYDKVKKNENEYYNQLIIKEKELNETQKKILAIRDIESEYETNILNLDNKIFQINNETKRLEKNLISNLNEIKHFIKTTDEYVSGDMLWPLLNSTRVTSEYGMRYHPIYHVWKLHKGIDIAAPYNEKIIAANDGTIKTSGYISGYGYTIIVDHGGGISTLYAHCNSLFKEVGEVVLKGEAIALVGSTGASTGPHLHFEVREYGQSINPREYISNK